MTEITREPAPSYARGTTAVPLLGETIGANLRRTVERFGEREALVVRPPGLPRHLRRAVGAGRPRGRAGCSRAGSQKGDRVGIWSPNRFEWVVVAVRRPRGSARSSSTSIPAYKAAELEHALNKAGVSAARSLARGFRQRTTARCWTRSASAALRCEQALVLEDDWDDLLAAGAARRRGGARRSARRALRSTTRSTSSTPRARPASRRARRSRTTTSSTTATSSAARSRYTEHDRVCIPVPFYHCFGMVLGNLGVHHARRLRRRPRRGVRPARRRSRRSRRSAARRSTACRRCSSPSSSEPGFARVRPLLAAHRDHGRRALPDRGDEAGAGSTCTWTRSRSPTA